MGSYSDHLLLVWFPLWTMAYWWSFSFDERLPRYFYHRASSLQDWCYRSYRHGYSIRLWSSELPLSEHDIFHQVISNGEEWREFLLIDFIKCLSIVGFRPVSQSDIIQVERRLKFTLDMIVSKKKRIALEMDRRNRCHETNMMRFWSIFSAAVNRSENESKYNRFPI